MKIKIKKIISLIFITFFVLSMLSSCATRKKRGPVPCPHFSIELLK